MLGRDLAMGPPESAADRCGNDSSLRPEALYALLLRLVVGLLLSGSCGPLAAQITVKGASTARAYATPISYVNHGGASNHNSGNTTPGLPGHAQGDLLLCVIVQKHTGMPTMPAGWTMLYTGTHEAHRATAFWKISSGSESNPTVGNSGGAILARCSAFRGVDQNQPFDAPHSLIASDADFTTEAGAVTTASDNAMLLFVSHIDHDDSSIGTPVGSTSWTLAYFAKAGAGTGISLHYGTRDSAGLQPALVSTRTGGSAAVSHGAQIALRPALTLEKPAGTVAGDGLLAAIAVRPETAVITAPAGWSLIARLDATSGDRNSLALYGKVAGSSEPDRYTFAVSTSAGAVGGLLALAGVDPTNPIDVQSGTANTASSTSHTTPSITTTVSDALIIATFSYGSSHTWSPPTGMTEVVDVMSRETNSAGVSMSMHFETQALAGATGTKTATVPGHSDRGNAHILALRPGPPLAPVNLSATPVNAARIDLSWTDASTNEAGFRIERKTGLDGVWAEIDVVGPNITTYSNTGLSDLTTYYYRVRAYSAHGASAYTNEATATTPSAVASFNVVEPGAHATNGKIFTKIAGQHFALEIVALDTGNAVATSFTGTVAVEVVDASGGGACASLPVVASFANQTFAAGEAGRHALTSPSTVPNAYRNARIRIKYPASAPSVTACSADNFAIRPYALTFLVRDANWQAAGTTRTLDVTALAGTTVHKAGRPFRIDASAYNGAATPVITSNYDGTPTAVLTACGGDACTVSFGTLALGTWSASAGTLTTTTATYNDVGAFNLQLEDTAFAAVDASDGTPVAQRTISSTPSGVGRFVPDRFWISAMSITPRTDIPACSGSSFTYMGERMNVVFTLTARAAADVGSNVTTRYAGNLARLNVGNPATLNVGAIDGTTPLSGRVNTSLGSSGTWTDGQATVTAVVSIDRAVTPDGPFGALRIGISPVDLDGIQLNLYDLDVANSGSNTSRLVGTTALRYGRLRLQNALGSQLISLPIPLEAQYWNGSAFVTNTADSCTPFGTSNVVLGNFQKGLTAAHVSVTVGGTLNAGVGTLRLSAPGAAVSGSVDVSINLSGASAGESCSPNMPASTALARAYLQGAWCGGAYNRDPTARATFGLYRSSNHIVHRRENF